MNPTTPATVAPTVEAAATSSSDQPKIVLHWLNRSRSQRILWLLEELNIPYELIIYHRNAQTKLAPPELKKVHDLGKSPVITITVPGSTETTVIAESGLITEYLIEHFGQNSSIAPKHWKDGKEGQLCGETSEWLRYKYFLHYAEGTLMPYNIISLICNTIKTGAPFFMKPITNAIAGRIESAFLNPNFESNWAFLENQLKTCGESEGSDVSKTVAEPYLCAPRLTGADILMSFPLIAAKGRGTTLKAEKYPLLYKYIERIEQEPGYKKAVAKIVEIEGSFTAAF